jgi:hypothetical protein
MADYAGWPEKTIAVTTLQLDGRNPRIPSGGAELSQRDLIAELVQHDDVYDLARDIAEQGYSPLESLIGLKDDGKTIILEGNRRLAALKLLINPDLAPPAFLNRFQKLAEKGATPGMREVRVLHAPTREAAAPLILRKHTRDQVDRWSPLMQARFYRTLAAGGASLAEMARQYGTTAGDMARFLRTNSMYEAACRIDLPEDVRKKVHDPRNFPAAVLQRLIDIPKARTFLGIVFDDKGEIRGNVHRDEFAKGYARILSDIAREKIDTRKLNTVADAEKYLAGLKKDEPDKTRAGSFAGSDLAPVAPAVTKAAPGGIGGAVPSRTAPLGRSVIPPGTRSLIAHPRIREIFNELKRLRVDDYPNASAVLFRVLLEIALGHHLSSTGKDKPLQDWAKKQGKPATWCPTLHQMLNVVVKDTSIPLSAQERKAIQHMLSKPDSVLTLDDLDSFVHSPFPTPTFRELRGYWQKLAGLFEIILKDPPKPPPPVGAKSK